MKLQERSRATMERFRHREGEVIDDYEETSHHEMA